MTKSNYTVQVKGNHYTYLSGYISPARWSTNSLIIQEVLKLKPKKILEIGPGPGTVTSTLRNLGFNVSTLDLDPDINPDFLLSFTDPNLAKKIGYFDAIIASEVFEHVQYKDFIKALISLKKCTATILMTVPDTNEGALVFGFRLRLPHLNEIQKVFKLRYKQIKHTFDGEHYWEIGKKRFSSVKVRRDISENWKIEKEHLNINQPYHRFFLLKK